MHIADGVLPLSVAAGCGAVSLALAAWSVRSTDGDDLPKVAVVTASFFVSSLIHVPLGPTSVHLLIPGLVGILLGRSAFLSILLGLLLQSLLFSFGGLTALGANALMMGVPALLSGLLFNRLRGTSHKQNMLIGALAGGSGTLLAATILAFLLASGGEDFFGVMKLAVLAHIPVFVIEALVSAFTVSFLYRVKPELLEQRLGVVCQG
ncbi:cobalt/nickel transport system permease protein [Malonomonas rubra DSM 5091]|uniref:Cobalt/nickel transport system permease protein n=1 Tax=Malonomonas rubra DSM 5091 TaxID=1122189 RepID=A0A1M6E3M8_MALRU|nr:cobalt transporter CbiM [Malonomonas rubra]SHI79980.1 cobalt/nickel transport system permease protein [Malonomonas rubra DSM 5091]